MRSELSCFGFDLSRSQKPSKIKTALIFWKPFLVPDCSHREKFLSKHRLNFTCFSVWLLFPVFSSHTHVKTPSLSWWGPLNNILPSWRAAVRSCCCLFSRLSKPTFSSFFSKGRFSSPLPAWCLSTKFSTHVCRCIFSVMAPRNWMQESKCGFTSAVESALIYCLCSCYCSLDCSWPSLVLRYTSGSRPGFHPLETLVAHSFGLN